MRPRILSPYSRGIDLPGIQPRGEMAINWSHPISNGLSYLRVFNAWGSARELFSDGGSSGDFSILGGAPTLGVVQGGVGLTGVGAIQYSVSNYTPPLTRGTCIAQVTAGFAPGDGVNHALLYINAIGGQNFTIYKLNDGTWVAGWVNGTDYRAVGAAAFNAGDTFSIAVTYDTAVNTKVYAKGNLQATNATPPVTTSLAGNTLWFGDNGGGVYWNTSAKDAIHYVGFWNRVLSTDEMALLNADPYCFLVPTEGEMPALFLPTVSTTGGARFKQRFNRSPLAYPVGATPGFDPSHPASRNGIVRFSGIATAGQGGFIDVLRGRKQSSIATPSVQINPQGPSLLLAAGSAAWVAFSGQDTTAGQTKGTIAAIVTHFNFSNSRAEFATNASNVNGGLALFGITTPEVTLRIGSLNCNTAVPLVVNVPYFVAVSADKTSGVLNAIARRLDTGQVYYSKTTPAITGESFDSDGTYLVGGWAGANLSMEGTISAAMHANNFLSLSELQQFAADPWSFWYPRSMQSLFTQADTPASTTQYAAFSIPQHSLSQLVNRMVGY